MRSLVERNLAGIRIHQLFCKLNFHCRVGARLRDDAPVEKVPIEKNRERYTTHAEVCRTSGLFGYAEDDCNDAEKYRQWRG